jgi:integrase
VRIPTHLRLSRHGIYFFRIVVPKALRPAFDGRREIKRSLHTRNVRAAMVAARQLALAAYQIFETTRRVMTERRPFNPNDPSTWPTAADVAGKFELTVEEDIQTGKRTFQIKADDNNDADIAAAKEIALAYVNAPTRLGKIASTDPDFLAADEAERAELEAETRPSKPAVEEARRKFDTSKLTAKERDRLLSSCWVKHVTAQAKSNWTKPRTVADYNQKFETFLLWIGDRPIYTVTKEDYSNFKNWLLTEYRSPKTKPDAPSGLDTRSVDKYTTAINGLFKSAQTCGYIPDGQSLPTAKQNIMTKKAVKKRADKRMSNRNLREDELAIAFDPVAYADENQVAHHFWGPLIALFTGARRAEVAQLLIRDVKQIEDGLWVIDISDDDLRKNVKSDAARRTVPIHPTLIEIGLLDYLAEVKAAKLGATLFPGITANKYAEKGNAIGQSWRRYLIARGLRSNEQSDDDPDTLTFHSMRHTAIALLKKKRVPYDYRCQMVGHEEGGQQGSYGGEIPPDVLAAEVLPVFKYPNLDFSKLRYKVGSLAVKKKNKARRNASATEIEKEAPPA